MKNLTVMIIAIWKKIKKQPTDVWFFYLFLSTFTLSIRKVLFFFPVKGIFNEYTGAYIYASGIFFCGIILTWASVILRNNLANKSSEKTPILRLIHRLALGIISGFGVIHKLSTAELLHNKATKSQNDKKCSTWNIFRLLNKYQLLLLPLSLVIWSFLTISWSENQTISLYRSIKFLELYGLFLYISLRLIPLYFNEFILDHKNVPRGTFSNILIYKNNIISIIILHFRAILLGFVFIMLFDHYLWDIWQGQVLFWIVCGVLSGIELSKIQESNNCSTWNNAKQSFNDEQIENKAVFINTNNTKNVPRGTFLAISSGCFIVIATGVVQALWGIAQFIMQHSVGFFWLKESLIGRDISGVAKIIINNAPMIRAYGSFPHSNILGGFLFFSIILTLLFKKLFHVEQIEETNIKNCSTWNKLSLLCWKIVPRGTIKIKLIDLFLLIQLIGLALTFSKSAIIALLVAYLYLNVPRGTINLFEITTRRDYSNNTKNCSTWNNFYIRISALFHVEQFRLRVLIFISLGIGFLTIFFSQFKFYAFFLNSLNERIIYYIISKKIILEWPIFGSGTGQFVSVAERIFPDLLIWQYQPVHNVFLLVWSDWGIVGLVLFILFLWRLFHLQYQWLDKLESNKGLF